MKGAREVGSTASPCVGCPMRSTCKAPCDRLLALLPAEEIIVDQEVRSTVLSSPALQGGGLTENFITIPDEWRDEPTCGFSREGTEGRWSVLVERHRAALVQAVDTPGFLTMAERRIVSRMLEGATQVQLTMELRISKQVVSRTWLRAIMRLRALLRGEPTKRAPQRRRRRRHWFPCPSRTTRRRHWFVYVTPAAQRRFWF
jgi:DNA-binding CsgD family transcriptional regulator